jgi:hypothetical protein
MKKSVKLTIKDLRRLIRENYAREIPQYAIDEICKHAINLDPKKVPDYCREKLEHYFKLHINSTSSSAAEMRRKIIKMHQVLSHMQEDIRELKKIKEELKDVVDQHVRRFLFI